MSILREDIHRLVEVFYQPPFKTFYVNSIDGDSFVKPVGVFVSLGITTSDKMLEDIREILSDKYDATIAEISSVKKGNQYLNTITNTHNPEKYLISDFGEDTLDQEGAERELNSLRELMAVDQLLPVLQESAPKIAKLQELIEKLSEDSGEGWKYHRIQKEEGSYRLFHKYVNYKKEGDVEYRIGIFISEKAN